MFRFGEPTYLYLLLLLPFLAAFYLYSNYKRRKNIRRFGDPTLLAQLMPDVSKYRPDVKFWIIFVAIGLFSVLLARPQFGSKLETVKRKGVEVIIALDISNSMLAQDVQPSRLEKAKRLISRLVDELDNDKVGMIVFAGDAFTQLPITSDYISAKMFLESINPSLISKQGTAIGEAINLAARSFTPQEGVGRAIIVITDGENHEDMNPLTTLGFSQAWSNIRAKETLSTLFEESDKRAMFWKQDRTLESSVWYDFTKGWSVIKYSNLKSDGTPGSNSAHADTDFPFFRLADAYLMYAEAVLRGGQGGTKEQALLYLKELRERAGISPVSSVELTLDFILEERSRELYWEGHRRIDLIRFGKFTKNYKWPWKNGVFSGVANIDSKYNIYPLPATELTSNPDLKQNTGY